jgi:hypothetical protein
MQPKHSIHLYFLLMTAAVANVNLCGQVCIGDRRRFSGAAGGLELGMNKRLTQDDRTVASEPYLVPGSLHNGANASNVIRSAHN